MSAVERDLAPPKRRRRKATLDPKGFRCAVCGSLITRPETYYPPLTYYLISRFINLLNADKGQDYSDAVLDCLHATFGHKNPLMRDELWKAGHLDQFERRFGKPGDTEYKKKCFTCGELKDAWEVTLDWDEKLCPEICEDCLKEKDK